MSERWKCYFKHRWITLDFSIGVWSLCGQDNALIRRCSRCNKTQALNEILGWRDWDKESIDKKIKERENLINTAGVFE